MAGLEPILRYVLKMKLFQIRRLRHSSEMIHTAESALLSI
jgi:hypothetical protein